MFKAVGSAANAVIIVLLIVTIGAFSLIKIEGQPIFQIMRNVMLASLGEETEGINIQGNPNSQRLNCDYKTGVCTWEQ
jgi:hypothetical protein